MRVLCLIQSSQLGSNLEATQPRQWACKKKTVWLSGSPLPHYLREEKKNYLSHKENNNHKFLYCVKPLSFPLFFPFLPPSLLCFPPSLLSSFLLAQGFQRGASGQRRRCQRPAISQALTQDTSTSVTVFVTQSCPTCFELHGLTVACKSSLSIEFSRQEYWSGLPFPSPGDLSNPGIESGSPALQEVSLPI